MWLSLCPDGLPRIVKVTYCKLTFWPKSAHASFQRIQYLKQTFGSSKLIEWLNWIRISFSDAFTWPWRFVEASKEQYSLRYESKYLLQMGNLVEYLYSFAVSYAIQGALMETALAGVLTAVAWPAVILSAGTKRRFFVSDPTKFMKFSFSYWHFLLLPISQGKTWSGPKFSIWSRHDGDDMPTFQNSF